MRWQVVQSTSRTIPTHVGKTTPKLAHGYALSDHPHACGENLRRWRHRPNMLGPSPRMWGKLPRAVGHADIQRTIPTHVGKTPSVIPNSLASTDHPHACGENDLGLRWEVKTNGPSPRMWGKPGHQVPTGGSTRTIPTHVGKTSTLAMRHIQASDHPHACGENLPPDSATSRKPGPSPRMWGKLIDESNIPLQIRTIPTHVGKTKLKVGWSIIPTDHPHACGENVWRGNPCIKSIGPSPRMWGKH